MEFSTAHVIGMALAFLLIFGVSIYSGRKVKTAADFDAGGGRAGVIMTSGAIMGTLIGGSSTVGTAQLAFTYGFSAWWFTLGGGIACLLLAIFYVGPLRRSGKATLVGIISSEYGKKVGLAASVLSSVGTFINIISQLISATAIIAIILPSISPLISLLIAMAMMSMYVMFGGVLGAGMVGVVKSLLLCLSLLAGGILVLSQMHGFGTIYASLDHATYFNLFARGVGKDGGAGLSLILGVLSTQSYAQALIAGKTDRVARQGALISAVLMPVMGIGGILIGLYMRLNCPELASAKMAFPQFVMEQMPPLLAGLVLATLLITVVGTGAGLSLGISTVVSNDIVRKYCKRYEDPVRRLHFSRLLIVAVLFLAVLMCEGPIGDMILSFAFMSMGLRGAVLLAPLCCALWMKGKVSSKWVLASVIVSPLVVLIFGIIDCLPFDPLFLGVALALVLCGIGRMRGPDAGKHE